MITNSFSGLSFSALSTYSYSDDDDDDDDVDDVVIATGPLVPLPKTTDNDKVLSPVNLQPRTHTDISIHRTKKKATTTAAASAASVNDLPAFLKQTKVRTDLIPLKTDVEKKAKTDAEKYHHGGGKEASHARYHHGGGKEKRAENENTVGWKEANKIRRDKYNETEKGHMMREKRNATRRAKTPAAKRRRRPTTTEARGRRRPNSNPFSTNPPVVKSSVARRRRGNSDEVAMMDEDGGDYGDTTTSTCNINESNNEIIDLINETTPSNSVVGRVNDTLTASNNNSYDDNYEDDRKLPARETNTANTSTNTTNSNIDSDDDNQWDCPKCTLLNPTTKSRCEACQYSNLSINTTTTTTTTTTTNSLNQTLFLSSSSSGDAVNVNDVADVDEDSSGDTVSSTTTPNPTTKTKSNHFLSNNRKHSLKDVFLKNVKYGKRKLYPLACGGSVYIPSVGDCTNKLSMKLIKELTYLVGEKLRHQNSQDAWLVTAVNLKRRINDGEHTYIQLILKGSGADKILHHYKDECPTICLLIKIWKNDPDLSPGDKLLAYPTKGETDIHNDQKKMLRTNLHFGKGKALVLYKGSGKQSAPVVCDKIICETNLQHHIYEGTDKMFCDKTICSHQGMLTGKSAGFTIVTNPTNKENARDRPTLLSVIFRKLIAFADSKDAELVSQSDIEDASQHLKTLQDEFLDGVIVTTKRKRTSDQTDEDRTKRKLTSDQTDGELVSQSDIEDASQHLKTLQDEYLDGVPATTKRKRTSDQTDEDRTKRKLTSDQTDEDKRKKKLASDNDRKWKWKAKQILPTLPRLDVKKPNTDYVSDPSPNDVVFGVGGRSQAGKKYTALIETSVLKHLTLKNNIMVDKNTGKQQSNAQRRQMTDEIITKISNNGGQFLRRYNMAEEMIYEVQDYDAKKACVQQSIKNNVRRQKKK